jgi:hypothetical protein
VLKGFIPAMREFQNFYNEMFQQGQILKTAGLDQIHPAKSGIFFARPVAETSAAQLTDAYAYRRQLSATFAKYVEYNAHHKTGKYTLEDKPELFGQWAGATINATLIDELVSQKYPAFTIDNPSVYYAKAAAAITEFSQKMATSGHQSVVEWINVAQKVGTSIYRGKVNSTQAATSTKVLRLYAVSYAESIPGFLSFYNSNFRWQYGPLEAVR